MMEQQLQLVEIDDVPTPTPPPIAPARTRARTTDPHTSHEAAREVGRTLTEVQTLVHGYLRKVGPMPDHRWIASFRIDHPEHRMITEQSLRSRRAELATAGLVRAYPQGPESITPRGRRCVVWEAVDRG